MDKTQKYVESAEKAECEEACFSPLPHLKKRRGKRFQRKDNRREKRSIYLHFFPLALILFLQLCPKSSVLSSVFHTFYDRDTCFYLVDNGSAVGVEPEPEPFCTSCGFEFK